MSNAYRALLIAVILAYIAAALSSHAALGYGAALGGHQVLGLTVAIFGALAHSLPLSYFMGSGYWIKYHAEASGAGPEWKQRHAAWLKDRGYPVIYLAGLAIVLTGVAGGLADTGRIAPAWHAVMAAVALLLCLLELAWVPPMMRRNQQLISQLVARHRVPRPGTPAAAALAEQHRAESVPPLRQLARILLFMALNCAGLWAWLRFGTEGWRDVSWVPFATVVLSLSITGLLLQSRQRGSGRRAMP